MLAASGGGEVRQSEYQDSEGFLTVKHDTQSVIGKRGSTVSCAFVILCAWDFAAPGQVMPEEKVPGFELPGCEGKLLMVIWDRCVCEDRRWTDPGFHRRGTRRWGDGVVWTVGGDVWWSGAI